MADLTWNKILFKTEQAHKEFVEAPKSLQRLVIFFADYACYFCGQAGITVTRVRERLSAGNESGVHPAGRAVDVRDEYYGPNNGLLRTFTDEQAAELVRVVNAKFPRDDERGVIVHHKVNDSLLHFHLQTPVAWLTQEERVKFT